MALTRTELKTLAQDAIMQGVANTLGYWNPDDYNKGVPEEQRDELRAVMQREADRVARLFGYDSAWSN